MSLIHYHRHPYFRGVLLRGVPLLRYYASCSFDAEDNKRVTISPGVTVGELMSFFLNHEICFESNVILPTVTYGGTFSGGCHVRAFSVKV